MRKTRIKKRSILPLNALRSFESAARLGGQNAAAHELLVTSGAVSHQIGNLEDFLGVELFSGSNRTPELTLTGKRLLGELTPAFDQIDTAIRSALDQNENTLHVRCYSTFALMCLIPRLSRFKEIHPDIKIQLTTDSYNVNSVSPDHELVILLVDDAGLKSTDVVLMREQLGFVIAADLIEVGAKVTPELLRKVPKIETDTRIDAWPVWLNLMGASFESMTFDTALTYEHFSFTIEAVTNGLGGCVTPYHLVSDRLQDGNIVAPFGFVESRRTYIIRPLRSPTQRSEAFCEWLKMALYLPIKLAD